MDTIRWELVTEEGEVFVKCDFHVSASHHIVGVCCSVRRCHGCCRQKLRRENECQLQASVCNVCVIFSAQYISLL